MELLKYQYRSFEKIPVSIWESPVHASQYVANTIASAIRQAQSEKNKIVIGFATGITPIPLFQELIRLHLDEGLSFRNVVTFNLDEYYTMGVSDRQSNASFMHRYLFDQVDIHPENIHIPDGTVPMDEVEAYCYEYEALIESTGGIDIQILGIGRTGHIGFNEPGSWENSMTRLVKLDHITRRDAQLDFIELDKVPYRAITMGIGSIMKAKNIYLLAFGMHKSDIVKKAVEGPVTAACPASFLQNHRNVKFILDNSASEALTRINLPWMVGLCNWTDDMICKAVVWLSLTIGKPILKLTDEDYNENWLSDLVVEHDSAYKINIRVFNRLQHTITGWPGGKPGADDSQRPERANPSKKRVILFSPHPDDDVISMGGTFIRLVEQGHDVHVAYQTSGNLAVHDHDALRFSEFLSEFSQTHNMDGNALNGFLKETETFLKSKFAGQQDLPEIRNIKALIRRGEARSGARVCGLKDENIHFLDLPFYETGLRKKNELSDQDVDIVVDIMQKIKPHQVYAAGDLADPHDTHKVCLDAILRAFDKLKDEEWINDCWLWLYRGAWHEWKIDQIEMAVPLSPNELMKKRKAIFMHQSQKDSPPFPGQDEREFWQRAEDRNRETARTYNTLGFANYEAIEAFVRWKFDKKSV
jgi:glucosamine-6-phosphate deaminase